jgi:ribulose kinase
MAGGGTSSLGGEPRGLPGPRQDVVRPGPSRFDAVQPAEGSLFDHVATHSLGVETDRQCAHHQAERVRIHEDLDSEAEH